MVDNLVIKKLLEDAKNIAVVGLSPKKNRPSNMVATYLIRNNYNVIPVNPGQTEILGCKCYPDLTSIPVKIDIVDIFRRSDAVLPVVEEAAICGADCVWMQQGIENKEAEGVAVKNGMTVIMNRCIKVEHESLIKNKFIF